MDPLSLIKIVFVLSLCPQNWHTFVDDVMRQMELTTVGVFIGDLDKHNVGWASGFQITFEICTICNPTSFLTFEFETSLEFKSPLK